MAPKKDLKTAAPSKDAKAKAASSKNATAKSKPDAKGGKDVGNKNATAKSKPDAKGGKDIGNKSKSKKQLEVLRQKELDAMLNPESISEYEESSEEETETSITKPPAEKPVKIDDVNLEIGSFFNKEQPKSGEPNSVIKSKGGDLPGMEQVKESFKNEEIDSRKQLKDAEDEYEKLKKKETEGKKLSNKDKRTMERLEARIETLKEAVNQEQTINKGIDDTTSDDGKTHDNEAKMIREIYREKCRPFLLQIHDKKDDATNLKIESFTISVKGKNLIEDAKLSINAKQKYGFLGPNGRGKSTLLYHLAAGLFELPPSWNCVLVEQEARSTKRSVVNEVLKGDSDLQEWLKEEKEIYEKLDGVLLQAAAIDDKTLINKEDLVVQSLLCRLEELSTNLSEKGNAEAEVRRILCGLGFSDADVEKPVSDFSGGWRMRISLAKALFLKPRLLLLDEPTNHLDLEATLWLEDYLTTYPYTIIVVSHDADFLDAICDQTMSFDTISSEGAKLQYVNGGYTQYKKWQEQENIRKQKEWKKSGKQKALKPRPDYVVNFDFPEIDRNQFAPGIGVKDVAFGYNVDDEGSGKAYNKAQEQNNDDVLAKQAPCIIRGAKSNIHSSGKLLFDGLNFRFDADSRVALVGPNGCGKTTLLKLLLQKLEPVTGIVEHSKGLKIGQFSQHFEDILPLAKKKDDKTPCMTSVQYLMSSKFGKLTEQQARATLGSFGLPSAQQLLPMDSLSGGQKARVAFAAITVYKPHMLIFDEPTNHLDIESVEALIEALAKYNGGIVLVSHDARVVQSLGMSSDNSAVFLVDNQSESTTFLKEIRYKEYVRQVLLNVEKKVELIERKMKEKQLQDTANRKKKIATLEKKRKKSPRSS